MSNQGDTVNPDPFAGLSPGDRDQAYHYVLSHKKLIEELTNTTSVAQDNAQSSASTSVFLALVTVLRNLLTNGKSGTPFFAFALVVVSLALAFEVIIGLLLLVMALIKHRLNKNSETLTEARKWLSDLFKVAEAHEPETESSSKPADSEPPEKTSFASELQKLYGSVPADFSATLTMRERIGLWFRKYCICLYSEEGLKQRQIENKVLYICQMNIDTLSNELTTGSGEGGDQPSLDAWKQNTRYNFYQGLKAAVLHKRQSVYLQRLQGVIAGLSYFVTLLNGLIAAFGVS